MLHIDQYWACIILKFGPYLYITGWLSRNKNTEDKDQELTGMNINVNAISTIVNMPVCKSIEDINLASLKDGHLQKLKAYIIYGWPQKRQIKTEHQVLAY